MRCLILFLFALTAPLASAESPLADACEQEQWDRVSDLIDDGDIDAAQPDGMTALHWAVYHGHLKTARRLVESGADPNATTAYSITPLSITCEAGHSELAAMLIAQGANVQDKLPGGRTMLHIAARTGEPKTVEQLLDAGVEIDAREARGQTPLMWAAAEGHLGVVDLLLGAGADVDVSTKLGFTAMFFAARNGRIAIAERLLEAGVDINAVIKPSSTSGRNPRARMSALMFAVESGHFELALMLVAHGADPNDQRSGFAPLHAMSFVRRARKGDGVDGDPEPRGSGHVTSLEFVRRLVDAGADVNLQLTHGRGGRAVLNKKGCTPLILASKTADVPFMKVLVELGADMTLTNAEGCNALLAASGIGVKSLVDEDPGTEAEVIAAVQYLLSRGMDINTVDDNGETVMHGAAYRNYPGEVRYLFEVGADPLIWNVKNKHGWTPVDIADGKRPGAFKPSPPTAAAIEDVLSD